jgi:hypothetical protein
MRDCGSYLVDDTGAGRHDREALEGVGAPLEEGEALGITLHLELEVLVEGVIAAVLIDLLRLQNRKVMLVIAHRREHCVTSMRCGQQ